MDLFDIRDFVVDARARGGDPRPAPPAEKALRRNNTSYPVQLTAKLRALHARYLAAAADPADPDHGWAGILRYYQYLVRAVMSDPEYGIGADGNARGLLVWATMGMGKTRLAAAVAMALWDTRPVVILVTRSLQDNMRSTINAVIGALNPGAPPEALARLRTEAAARFSFVSMDAYNAADQMARAGARGASRGARVPRSDLVGATGGLDDKLLIIDEAHNFFRAVINSSAENANARRIYDIIMSARNLRLLFLTGTPAAKDPFELVPCFNMLAGRGLLPTQYEVFYRLYVDRGAHRVRNRERLANRILGLVSHVTHTRPSEPGPGGEEAPRPARQARDDGWFPEERPTIVSEVEMGPDQYRQYLLAREKEEAEGRGGEGAGGRGSGSSLTTPPLALPGSEKKAMRSYYVRSRTLSTFCPPREWFGAPVEAMPGDVFTAESLTGPKLALIAERVDRAPGPVLVYSQFVDAGGLKPLGRFLERLGYAPWASASEPAPQAAGGGSGPEAEAPERGEEYAPRGEEAELIAQEWHAQALTQELVREARRAPAADARRAARETLNTLERWLLAAANAWDFRGTGGGPWALHRALLAAPPAATQVAEREMGAAGVSDPGALIARLSDIAARTVAHPPPALGDLRVWLGHREVRVECSAGSKRIPLYPGQGGALAARGRAAGLSRAGAAAAVARAALRYLAVLAGGQHLGRPRSHYKRLYDLGIRNEGFASPFNSRMVALGRPDTTFCSLFPDTDAVFGSLGSFFSVDFARHPGGWSVNPPFLEGLMAEAVDRVLQAAPSLPDRLFVLLLPAWDDSVAVRAAADSPLTLLVERLAPGGYELEDPAGRRFVAPFGCYEIAIQKARGRGSRPTAAEVGRALAPRAPTGGRAQAGTGVFVPTDPEKDLEAVRRLREGATIAYTDAEWAAVERVAAAGELREIDPWYDPAAPTQVPYRPGKKAPLGQCEIAETTQGVLNLHHGQRKLFISELQCLTHFLPQASSEAVVVYAGAAPGIHIPFLLELFPGTEWHLYDPAEFLVKPSAAIHIHRELFTDEVARSWAGRCDIFISDIRVPQKTEAEFEAQVALDMEAQAAWARLAAPRVGAMLKFRPPYVGPGAETDRGYDYLRGRVLFQTWPPGSSTEGRLVVEAADVGTREPFNPAHYQDAMAEHNLLRAWATYAPPAAGLGAVPGYDRCFDCTNEAAAWQAYSRLPGALSHKGDVAALMNRLTQVTHQRLEGVEKKGDTRTSARAGLKMHGYAREWPGPRRAEKALAEWCRLVSRAGPPVAGGDAGRDAPKPRGYYAIISGEVPNEVREAIKAANNAPANAHGAVIKAILVSKTGAEGLDLKWIRETHVCEPYWDKARLDQVAARAARMGSHDGLPREEREVQPYVYIATANRRMWELMRPEDREPKTIDQMFYERALDRYETIVDFRQLLAESAIECELFSYGNCRTCVPTGAPLFHDDPALDIRLPDPCEVRCESEVVAKPVSLGDTTYYYTADPSTPSGYVFYTFSKELDGYAPVDPADPLVGELTRALG
jgi:hypothetical protein